MLLREAYRYRIYPDFAQEELFRRTIGCCRLIYNLCLEQKNEHLRRKKPLSKYDQIKQITLPKDECPFLREGPHHPLQQSVDDLHKAFANYFERLKKQREPRKTGIPVDPNNFPQ